MNCDTLVASLSQLDVSTLLSNLSSPQKVHRRKRRRGEVANPSNTLDALVAKKADEQPFEKRYLTEQEAIEGPDDEEELKKMELDPDVSTRTCSTCGYQGKWVSEMIRHKRVHTSERPFKCRYCSRTSKWKADLIRHVAKTHGIRVVSKYSRSKVFDPISADCSQPENIQEKRSVTYRCSLCTFEDERVSILNQHVTSIHATSPCVCRCGASFEDVQSALVHSGKGCSDCEMTFNVVATYDKASPLSPCRSETSSDSGIHTDPDEDTLSIPPSSIITNNSPLLMSPTFPVVPQVIPQASLIPDLQSALMNLQTSFYLASLLQTTMLSPTIIQPTPTIIQPTVIPQNDDLIDIEM